MVKYAAGIESQRYHKKKLSKQSAGKFGQDTGPDCRGRKLSGMDKWAFSVDRLGP